MTKKKFTKKLSWLSILIRNLFKNSSEQKNIDPEIYLKNTLYDREVGDQTSQGVWINKGNSIQNFCKDKSF